MLTTEKRVVIVGAGPSGLAAAMFLAKRNINTIVLEKEQFPRDKICGDALSGKTIFVLNKLGLELDSKIGQEFAIGSYGVKFTAPNLKSIRIPFSRKFTAAEGAPGFIAKRFDFDQFLYQRAKDLDAIEIRENVAVRRYQKERDGCLVKLSNEQQIKAKMLLVADGANSSFVHQLKSFVVKPKHHCYGLRAYYQGVSGMDSQNFIELLFLKECLPGYFWIFPLPNGAANVGLGMRSDFIKRKKVKLKKLFFELLEQNSLLKERFSHAKLKGGIHQFGLPLGSVKRNISGSHFLLLGDAAALIDPFTGEGIGNGMMSGMLAAEHVEKALNANCYNGSFNQRYDTSVYKRMGRELALSYKMQQMIKFPFLFNLVVNKAEKNNTLQETISCMFDNLDLRKELKNPKFYFKLLFN